MRILSIEDEPKTAAYIRQGLTEQGHVVDCASDGIEGLHLANSGRYDLILLDVTLPGADGWQVLKGIREQQQTPVLFLSGRDQVEDRVKGLELGADDYLGRHAGEVVSRTLIAENVWDMNFDSDTNVIDVAVRRLRAKVDDPFTAKLIHTIRGVGYVLDSRAA